MSTKYDMLKHFINEQVAMGETPKNNPYFGSNEFADGWFLPTEGRWYKHAVESIPNGGNFIEIGSYQGLSLSKVKDVLAEKNINSWAVDIKKKPQLVKNCDAWGIEFINRNSKNVSQMFENEFFDLVFIDADHRYEKILEDIRLWRPKVKKGGMLAGHDYCDRFEGIQKAVGEELDGHQKGAGTIWYWMKK